MKNSLIQRADCTKYNGKNQQKKKKMVKSQPVLTHRGTSLSTFILEIYCLSVLHDFGHLMPPDGHRRKCYLYWQARKQLSFYPFA
jgi:hypothetical protein